MSGTIHEQLQDRMPEVVRGTAEWDPSETAHLAACAECRAEWELIRTAAKVGAGIEREFNVARAARAVTERLRHPRPVYHRPAIRTLVGVAAAAVIAFAYLGPAAPRPAPTPVVEGRLFPELDSLGVEELTVIADGLDTPLSETPLGVPQGIEELDSTQLTRVLRALEG